MSTRTRKVVVRVMAVILAVTLLLPLVFTFAQAAGPRGSTYKVHTGVYEPSTWNMECGRFYSLSELGFTKSWVDHPTSFKGSSVVATSFSDVKSSAWYYKPVMDMTKSGLFTGTTTPVNGVGTFLPEGSMTRAQFATVVARAFWPEELAAMGTTSPWYVGALVLLETKGVLDDPALDNGLLFSTRPVGSLTFGGVSMDMSASDPEGKITRAEAGIILLNTYKALNLEGFNDTWGYLLDYNTSKLNNLYGSIWYSAEKVGGSWVAAEDGLDSCTLFWNFGAGEEYYTETPSRYTYLQIGYLLGLVNGISGGKTSDTQFTQVDLDPDGILTRAQGAALVYRVIESSGRTDNNNIFVTDPETDF